jgi:zinc/manganese transport system ATP-binding protein
MNALTLDNVRVALGGHQILSDISLEIGAGQFIGMLGPNGAGKSTLMRTLLGLVRPSRGSLRVLDGPVKRGNPAIGYMPQTRALDTSSRLRGYDFVACAVNGNRWGSFWTGADARREVDWAIGLVEAGALARRPLAELSGGERQRLLLAQALIGRPRLLLLDEPLAGLDPHHQQLVVDLVAHVRQELDATVLFSAHDVNPLLNVLDQVLYLGRGQAVLGPVKDVITGPVLSRLYGVAIDVVRLPGRIFVMAGNSPAEEADHVHDA